MTPSTITPSQVRISLLLRDEIALLDLRHEAAFATGHPLFAANMAAGRIALEAETRLPCKDVLIAVYDAGESADDRFVVRWAYAGRGRAVVVCSRWNCGAGETAARR